MLVGHSQPGSVSGNGCPPPAFEEAGPLTYANERTNGDERVTTAYALVFPVAMITKVIVVQFLV